MTPDPPIACSLAGSDLERRFAELRRFGAEALTARSCDQDGHRLWFRKSPGAEARLRSIVAAEEECCSFLSFSLTEIDGQLELRIASPPDGRPVADQLAGAFG